MSHIKDPTLYENTLRLLQTKMRRAGDFPSLGKSLQRIQEAMHNDNASESELVEAVLGDVSLTQKTLRLANSAMYSSFGGSVSTVTQALLVLGTDTVGHLATSLKIFDQLESAASTSAAKSELSKSTAAGMISRQVATTVAGRDGEEAAVASLVHRLGWLLVTFYLPEQSDAVRLLCDTGVTDEQAEARVLGAPAWVIGQALGKDWGLPDVLCDVMNPAGAEEGSHASWICTVAAFSREYAQAVGLGKDEKQLAALAARYSQGIGCEPTALLGAASAAVSSDTAMELVREAAAPTTSTVELAGRPADATLRLTEAAAEMRSAAGKLRVNQVVSMATELAHRALGFNRTMFFLRNAGLKKLQARIVLGSETQLPNEQLQFEDAFAPNVFHLALSNRRTVFISNAQDAGIRKRLPGWFLESMPDVRSFLLLPVSAGSQTVGLLYADWGSNDKGCTLSGDDLAQLDSIRLSMGHAFEQLSMSQQRKAA